MARSSGLMRKLDRYIGEVASLVLAPILNRSKTLPKSLSSIGILQPTAIGDTIIGSGVLVAIQQRFPDAEITVYHGATNGAAVALLPGEFKKVQTTFTNPLKCVALLRRGNHDLIVDMTPWPNMTALCARVSAPITVGFSPDVNRGRGRLFDLSIDHSGDRHELENVGEMASHFSEDDYEMVINRKRYQPSDELDLSRLVLCHLSAGGSQSPDKSWPNEYWAELVRSLAAAGFQIGFTGVKSEEPRILEVLEKTDLKSPDVVSLCGKLKLDELGELLAQVPLLVTIDTGVLHLAAAVNGRSIGLHGPTSPKRWGSLSPNGTGLQSPHPRSGYMKYGFETIPGETAQTMKALLPATVISTALEVLSAERPKVAVHSIQKSER